MAMREELRRTPLEGRVALITGGASGIGLATAVRLLADGASVVLADLDPEKLRWAERELARPDRVVASHVLDVREAEDVSRVVGEVHARFERIDILVNSAGVSCEGTLLTNSLDAWRRVIDINLTGSYLCAQAVARQMIARRSGRIIFLASISGQQVWSGRVAYCASKGGVVALAKSCAIDLAQFGITVNSVSPGPIETPQTSALHSDVIREAVVRATPMARYGRPDEVADVIAFLASDDSRFVTGHDLVVDGGLTSAAILYDVLGNLG